MSVDGSVDKLFGGDERHFRLAIENLLALQTLRDAGPLEIVNRLRLGTWRIEDVQETLRLGLIGGGLEIKAARKLVEDHVTPGKLLDAADIAFGVLWPAIHAPEPVGKAEATAEAPEAMDASPLSPFMEMAPPSDSPPIKSDE